MTARFRDLYDANSFHTCWYQQGKICYDKKGAVTVKNSRYKKTGIVLRPYWCSACNFWHLTKKLTPREYEQTPAQKIKIAQEAQGHRPGPRQFD